MKKIIFNVFVIAAAVIMNLAMVSCDKEKLDTPLASVSEKNGSELVATQVSDDVGLEQFRATSSSYSLHAIGTPFGIEIPNQGIPNESKYRFYIANPDENYESVEIIFTSPQGGEYGDFWMSKNSRGNFYLDKTLSQDGKYLVKYKVYYKSSGSKIISPDPNYVINSRIPPLYDNYPYKDESFNDVDDWGFFRRECTSD